MQDFYWLDYYFHNDIKCSSRRPVFMISSCLIKNIKFKEDWSEGYQLAAMMNFKFQQCVATPLGTIITNVGSDGLRVMTDMMLWNPEKRPSASAVSPFEQKKKWK